MTKQIKTSKPKNKFLSVVLSPELFERVKVESKAVDRPMSKYVELLLRDTFHELDVKRHIASVQQ